IRTYAWMIILRDNGVLNGVLQATGLIQDPLILLNTDVSVILGMTYGFLPFAILPLFVSIDRLDDSLVQAARDLYASGRAAFLHAPIVVLIIFSFNNSRRTFVWRGFTLDWYPKLFADTDLLDALRITMIVAAIAVVASTILGSLLGLGLARLRFRGSGATETLILLPMVTPEIIMGISLLIFFTQLAGWLPAFGRISLAHITFCIS